MNIKLKSLLLFIILAQILAACASNLIPATSAPLAVATPTNDPSTSAKVVQAFWDALETGDVDMALSYVSDDIACRGTCYFTGKVPFKTYLEGYLMAGYTTKVSDLKTIGSIVRYTWEWYRNGFFVRNGSEDEMMEVEDGKIVYWESYHR
ncbi:MAG TPA: nuclear transport factor 2 family protein [Anaerolineales bacterium]